MIYLENEGAGKGVRTLATLKNLLPDFQSVYSAIVQNADYANRTREEVQKYYHLRTDTFSALWHLPEGSFGE